MKKNKYMAAVGVIVLLLTVPGAIFLKFRTPSLPVINEDIDSIIMNISGNGVVLEKRDGVWVIEGKNYIADSSLINSIISEMKEMTIISTVKKISGISTLDGLEMVSVKLYSGSEIKRDVFLGAISGNRKSAYIRLIENSVAAGDYIVSGINPENYTTDIERLREKRIMTVTTDIIEKINCTVFFNNYCISKSTDSDTGEVVWKDNRLRKSLDTEKVNKMLQGFVNVTASSFYDGFAGEEKIAEYEIFFPGNMISFEVFGKNDKNEYLCRCSELPYAFFWPSKNTEQILKTFSDLMKRK